MILDSNIRSLTPLHPDTQQLIKQVEDLSGRMVHVTEDPDLKVMTTVRTARGIAPAHFLIYRSDTEAVDYLVAYQLGFLVRLFSCPAEERNEVMTTLEEQEVGVKALELTELPPNFACSMVDHIVIQVRTYSVGFRVDQWIRDHCPSLRAQQEHSILSQIKENAQSLAPDVRKRFPKPLIDANSAMNAAYAVAWGEILGESRHAIPFKALGYTKKAVELLAMLKSIPNDPCADHDLIKGWADALGLTGSFHFQSHRFE